MPLFAPVQHSVFFHPCFALGFLLFFLIVWTFLKIISEITIYVLNLSYSNSVLAFILIRDRCKILIISLVSPFPTYYFCFTHYAPLELSYIIISFLHILLVSPKLKGAIECYRIKIFLNLF